jgi:hypothetical protein
VQGAAEAVAEEHPVVGLVEVYGDAAYGTGQLLAELEGRTVRCPAGCSASIRPRNDRGGVASFGTNCLTCPLRVQCTTSESGHAVD